MFDLTGAELGKYRLLNRIGKGGMSLVYRAHQRGLDRHVAVKVLLPHLAESDDFVRRFRREAQGVSGLRHPNLVQVFDFDHDEARELYYMVMEYIQGETLKARLAQLNRAGQRLPPEQVIHFFEGLLAGLGYAHERNMVHRDLKPANIMFDPGGRPVLTDFGIAMIVGGERLTMTGAVMGTPAYMAPEQGQGDIGDQRSDLYSLGVILFESLTGRVPFDADTPYAILGKHIAEPIPALRAELPEAPEALETAVSRALAKSPDERFQSATEMWLALAAARNEMGDTGAVRVRPIGPPAPVLGLAVPLSPETNRETAPHIPPEAAARAQTQPRATVGRSKILYRIFAALAGVLLLVGGWFYYQRNYSGLSQAAVATLVTEGRTQLDASQPEAALAAFDKALERDPREVGALLGRVEAYVALGQPDVALQELDRAVTLVPDSAELLIARGRYRLLYTSGPDMAASLADFDQALEIDPNSAPARFARGWAILNFQDDPPAALADLREAVRLDPADAEAYRTLAVALAQAGDHPAALNAIQTALQLDPGKAEYQIESALIHRSAGDLAGAVSAGDAAIALQPENASHFAMRGYLYFEQGDFDRAVSDANEALRLEPDLASALYVRGLANYQLGNYQEALADLDAVQARQPFEYNTPFLSVENEREINLDRALALQAVPGREPEALEAYEASVTAYPDWFAPLYYRGVFQAARGETEAARLDLGRALDHAPDDEWRARIQAALDGLGS